ncbi:nucleoside/nucleotide kinase family protein [Solirhodobacter olei]|uniref:nucleoside/nucleotide kinase family protein n=1 Tax=Solirhodobacter olei TaxID=2493082 RepID=UPI000FDBBD6E|nr:nucleoside/nucleotide kinase family protein [Solirhodobacter olei]
MEERTDIETLSRLLSDLPPGRRRIVAIAGAPGSGKSHVAEALVEAVNARVPGRAAVLPMDGYHFDDAVLEARGSRARKGAPDTFDVGGFAAMLVRLRGNAEEEVAVPVFDRAIEIARAGARLIPRSVELIVAEGNYLLLDMPPWDRLDGLFDLTVRLDVPEAMLRQRLEARWQGYGLPPGVVRTKMEENDLPNGRLVRARSRPADLVLAN